MCQGSDALGVGVLRQYLVFGSGVLECGPGKGAPLQRGALKGLPFKPGGGCIILWRLLNRSWVQLVGSSLASMASV